jgi:hypothetical protein
MDSFGEVASWILFGVLLQLECWNAGMLEKWVLAFGSEKILHLQDNGSPNAER